MSELNTVISGILNLPPDQLTEASSPKNTKGWDSLKHIELVLAIEGHFGVKFAPSEIVTIDSVGSARSLLSEKGVAA